eukprot:CAMPEP_0118639250 /NCGR_PEP_ID=MMETSP0785-20121206/4121_1 /TAXON_ID=91992 /ORGANISM="Bolidomonas pacifica, Strain CCMP 1866" /LENGTH=485 /DNA_ID=CAMNT_0006530561 /DNA_START=76 /DNA_END=1530 /DNA_ORIENTATION=+
MATREETRRLNQTLEVASSLHNTITALVERNGCKFSTTLDLKTLDKNEEGEVVLPNAESNSFAPPQEEPMYPSTFVPPEHKTLRHASKTYQLEQVEHLPTNGMLSDSEDEPDDKPLRDAGPRFHHNPLTQSPFLASGKLSKHFGISYIEVGKDYEVGMVQGLPGGEWAGEEIGFSPRFVGESDDDDDSVEKFAAIEAKIKEEQEMIGDVGKEVKVKKVQKVQKVQKTMEGMTPNVPKLNLNKKRRHKPSPRTNKILSLTSRPQEKKTIDLQTNPKGSLSARVGTAETEEMEDEKLATNTTANVNSANNNETVLSTINWEMSREEMDAIAANYNRLMTSPIKVKTKKKDKPFCNYKKFVEMQKETKGKDWYVFQDGSPYISKWEQMRMKDKGDPNKLMDPRGFRRFFGRQSEWEVHEFGIRNSSTYEGHEEEAGLVDGRDDKRLKHKWLDKKGWSSIGTSTKPQWRRRCARGYAGMHGNINENTTH